MEYLTPEQLSAYALTLAERPARWLHWVEHDPVHRLYKQIVDAPEVNAWLICWNEGHDTGFHDHDGSAGGVVVVAGEVIESRLVMMRNALVDISERYHISETFRFGPDDIHRVRHVGNNPAVTIHCYSPPLQHMGSYYFDGKGEFHRQHIGADTALKPLEQAIQDDRIGQKE